MAFGVRTPGEPSIPAVLMNSWLIASLRIGVGLVAVAAFALIARVAQGHGLAAALLGFIATRTVIVRLARRETLRADSLRQSR